MLSSEVTSLASRRVSVKVRRRQSKRLSLGPSAADLKDERSTWGRNWHAGRTSSSRAAGSQQQDTCRQGDDERWRERERWTRVLVMGRYRRWGARCGEARGFQSSCRRARTAVLIHIHVLYTRYFFFCTSVVVIPHERLPRKGCVDDVAA